MSAFSRDIGKVPTNSAGFSSTSSLFICSITASLILSDWSSYQRLNAQDANDVCGWTSPSVGGTANTGESRAVVAYFMKYGF